jgi:hypothetical protein
MNARLFVLPVSEFDRDLQMAYRRLEHVSGKIRIDVGKSRIEKFGRFRRIVAQQKINAGGRSADSEFILIDGRRIRL